MLSKIDILINNRFMLLSNLIKNRHGLRSLAAIARNCQFHPQVFADYKSHKLKVGVAVLAKLITKFPEANAIYVLTGIGEPIDVSTSEASMGASIFREDPAKYLSKMGPKDLDGLKIEYLIYRTRCEAYENAMKLSGNYSGSANIEPPENETDEPEEN